MHEDLSRRAFITSALTAGFALAVSPAGAETIATDATDLVAGEVKIPAAGGPMPAYRAMPKTGTTFPIVLVVQEIFGVHEHIRDVCRRFAKAGYCAVASELFARQGDVSKIKDIQEIIQKVVTKVPDAQVMADLDVSYDWAVKQSKGDATKLAITGFCWGGRISWLYAAHQPKLKAAGAWYGRISSAPNELQPKSPIDLAKQLKAPVLGLYGGKDHGIPVAHLDMMKAELAAANNPSEIIVYPDAGHGFFADYRPGYDKSAAEDAWKRLLEWFKKYGAA
jgi:carboxymethylenebutenolidase